ncbi:uncharacterized protein LOC112904413 [Agrilus planipennis]|uniref:Uncharacterized protein LOC112904413 n=1 Tax=Agrilus planipennis TaxID=224129 RepID=A0A7F5R3I0_AGRPL|nr:uncharacterized protein LOC112904413 [Agrilus planipennis]
MLSSIEAKSEYVISASKYQKENCPSSLGSVRFINHFITENSLNVIEKLLKEYFADEIKQKPRVCVVGLHACADLSVTMLDIFSKMSYFGVLAIMPCCYHRLKQKTNGEFFNFPVSNVLKMLGTLYNGEEFLKVPFLRLACQQTIEKFKSLPLAERQKQSKSWMLRAILQFIAKEGKLES